MAKKAARSAAKKSRTKTSARRMAARRSGVDFKPLHDAMDAVLAELKKYKKGIKRDALILELKVLSKFRPCPKTGMFVELE